MSNYHVPYKECHTCGYPLKAETKEGLMWGYVWYSCLNPSCSAAKKSVDENGWYFKLEY